MGQVPSQGNTPAGRYQMTKELELDGDLNHDGVNVGLYGAAPVPQAAAIANASGGVTVDAEARTAVNSVLTVLRNLGLIAT